MRKLEKYPYPMERAKRVKFQKDNNESDRSNETCENCENNNNTFHNMEIIDDNNERDELNDDNNERDEVNDDNNERDELNDDNNERDEFNSDSSITNNVVDDINICDAIGNEVDNDFTPSHLATWCKTLNIPMTHADALLKDIRKHKCFRTIFPSAIRTILGTPKSTQIKIVPPGEYYHKGLVNELVRVLSKHNIENVNLTLNIDGLPLFKSSGQQLWPILISVAGIPGEIMVGAYCGEKKPNDINLFLEEFVNEMSYLINNGLEINNKLLPVKLQCISADAPAKSFLLSTKGHTGYDSCLKCFIHGKYVKNRVCFPGTNANLKTGIDFQNSNNILQLILHIDFVSDVVLDYMHVFIIIMENLTIDNGLFYVIEFYDGIQIIPDKWVIEDEMLAYWPNVKSDKDFDTIVYTRSSFSNAKIKFKKAEYESDIDSPYNTDEKKK
ncbi:uncharacterized protein [Temnothorax longispinosus]|uniref:uncharacterized protein n=1 Tax=Temnothorax longispinosus TaxID=300112 RepID=UPI003A99B654